MKRSTPQTDLIARARVILEVSAPALDDLQQVIADVEARGTETEAAVARLDAERPTILASGTRAELAEHDDRAAAAAFDRDQAREVAARLKIALAPAIEADRLARATADRAKVEAKVAKAVEALGGYTAAVETILLILAANAVADEAIADFRRAHPSEAPIASAEARVRVTPGTVTKGKPVRGWAWAYHDGRLRDPALNGSRVLPYDDHEGNRRAGLYVPGAPRAGGFMGAAVTTEWWSRDWSAELEAGTLKPTGAMAFRVENSVQVWPVEVWRTPIETLPADCPTPLAEAVRLPALRLGEKGWSGNDGSAAEILAALNRVPIEHRKVTAKTAIEQVVEPAGKLIALPPRRGARRALGSASASACARARVRARCPPAGRRRSHPMKIAAAPLRCVGIGRPTTWGAVGRPPLAAEERT